MTPGPRSSPTGLSLKGLECLVALARERHFGRAADACAMTQPALSAQVRKLEDGLGVLLCERTNRRVWPTDVGERLAAEAREILIRVEGMAALARVDTAPLSGRLRLGAIATVGPYLFRHLLCPLKRAHPRLDLEITEGRTASLVAALREGRLDGVLLSPPIQGDDLALALLYREAFVVIAPVDHPMFRLPHLSVEDLDARGLVVLEEGHCLRDQTLELLPGRPLARADRPHAASLETLRHMVAAGSGYSMLPALAVGVRDGLDGLIGYRDFAGRAPGRVIALAWRKGAALGRDMTVLADLIRRETPGVETLGPEAPQAETHAAELHASRTPRVDPAAASG